MKNSIKDFLNQHFKIDVAESDMASLEEIFSEETYAKDDIVFKEGELGDRMYFVVNGLVKVFLTELDNGKTIALMKPGEVFGEIAFFDKQPHSAEAGALAATELFVLDIEKFNIMKQSNAQLALKITDIVLMTLAKRLRGTTRKMYGLY